MTALLILLAVYAALSVVAIVSLAMKARDDWDLEVQAYAPLQRRGGRVS